ISAEPASPPTSTGMSYLRPRESITFSNRKALRWLSGSPRNCSRTSGCNSVSLLIGMVTRMSLPACSRPSTYLPSEGQYDAIQCSLGGLYSEFGLAAFVGDGFHLGDDGRRGRHDPGNDPRHIFARLGIDVQVQALHVVPESRALGHRGERPPVGGEQLARRAR